MGEGFFAVCARYPRSTTPRLPVHAFPICSGSRLGKQRRYHSPPAVAQIPRIRASFIFLYPLYYFYPTGTASKNKSRALRPWTYFCFNRKYIPGDIQGSYLRVMVEVRGVEPLSENNFTGCSPGADGHCGRLIRPVPLPRGRPSRRAVR